jgi:outer membrane receptor protein involved in Fe transport
MNRLYSKLLAGSSMLVLILVAQSVALPAFAQTAPTQSPASQSAEIPEIVATAPSPIPTPLVVNVRGRRDDRLTVVDQSFSTVTFIPAGELLRNGGKTLGDQLNTLPGISSSGFAPGAASRPVIRGLDNFRVRVQENGIGSQDVSDLGEDHGTPIDPLAAQRVEVIRGPATLRFGSTAIGGVVSVDNNRIPSVQRAPVPAHLLWIAGWKVLRSWRHGPDSLLCTVTSILAAQMITAYLADYLAGVS